MASEVELETSGLTTFCNPLVIISEVVICLLITQKPPFMRTRRHGKLGGGALSPWKCEA